MGTARKRHAGSNSYFLAGIAPPERVAMTEQPKSQLVQLGRRKGVAVIMGEKQGSASRYREIT